MSFCVFFFQIQISKFYLIITKPSCKLHFLLIIHLQQISEKLFLIVDIEDPQPPSIVLKTVSQLSLPHQNKERKKIIRHMWKNIKN